jgi:AraC-like DNA-binding protein/quercetin dioxygenase-like cupin family protein
MALSVSRKKPLYLREKDMSVASPKREVLRMLDRSTMPVTGRASDYPAGHIIDRHSHRKSQLIYAVHGVMVVAAAAGQWVVPPTHAIWMPAGIVHWIRCVGELHMRSIYVQPDAAVLPQDCVTVSVSPLLRELIQAATLVATPYAPGSRDARLMRLLLDEIAVLPRLPLHLPQPIDARLQRICKAIVDAPDDASTLEQWAHRLGANSKTIQRLFARETGMTFGQWRQQARLLMGLEQLAGGTKVVDVALNLGYQSPSAFATMFKRQFGHSPSAYFR